jgi:hypothetical protein
VHQGSELKVNRFPAKTRPVAYVYLFDSTSPSPARSVGNTKTVEGSANPLWEEYFEVNITNLETQTLAIRLYQARKFDRTALGKSIGEVRISPAEARFRSPNFISGWFDVQGGEGKLRLYVEFVPAKSSTQPYWADATNTTNTASAPNGQSDMDGNGDGDDSKSPSKIKLLATEAKTAIKELASSGRKQIVLPARKSVKNLMRVVSGKDKQQKVQSSPPVVTQGESEHTVKRSESSPAVGQADDIKNSSDSSLGSSSDPPTPSLSPASNTIRARNSSPARHRSPRPISVSGSSDEDEPMVTNIHIRSRDIALENRLGSGMGSLFCLMLFLDGFTHTKWFCSTFSRCSLEGTVEETYSRRKDPT